MSHTTAETGFFRKAALALSALLALAAENARAPMDASCMEDRDARDRMAESMML